MKFDLSQMINSIGPGPKNMKKESEKVIIKGMLGKKLNTDNKQVTEIINTVAAKTGLNPAFLAANAFQEGMNLAIMEDSGDKEDLPDYLKVKEETTDSGSYPVSGFAYYGLDTFGDSAQMLKDKGYLDKDFDFEEIEARNEKGQTVKTGAFRTHEDALMAKAAMIKNIQDSVAKYAQEKGLKLEPKSMDYFTMSAYNSGMGNARIMMDEMMKSKAPQSEFIQKGMTSRKGVHKNIVPRLEKMDMISGMMVGPVEPVNKVTPSLDEVIRRFSPQFNKKK